MRVSQAEKDRSHRRIVEVAARLIRERGLEGASVAEVMTEAGLTHGGFYRHFESKDALIAEALSAAFAQSLARLNPGEAADFHALYLSRAHLDHPGLGCPVAALASDIGRASSALKAAFGVGVNRMVSTLAERMKRRAPSSRAAANRKQAMREMAMLVGAIVVARAVDPATARELLEACGGEDARGTEA